MELEVLNGFFSVCKLEDYSLVDFSSKYLFLSKTDEETSLVCKSDKVPSNAVKIENGWQGFRISGVLDFSLTGILSGICDILAENKIGIFAVSTYNTDYIFIKENNFQNALAVLKKSGYIIKTVE